MVNLHGVGILRNERIASPDPWPKPETAPEPEMSRGQVIALLECRVAKLLTRNGDSLFEKVLTYLRAVGSDEPTCYDYTKLSEWVYVRHNRVTDRYDLLPPGNFKATEIAKKLARDFEIHHVTVTTTLPRTNTAPWASCSCGGWHQSGRRHQEGTLYAAANKHLAAVKAGTWKRPRPVAEFLNEYDPLRFNFSGATSSPTPTPDNPSAVVASVSATAPGPSSH